MRHYSIKVVCTCPLKIECADCGEIVWCYSDEEIEKIQAEKKKDKNGSE